MRRLPVVSGHETLRALEKTGYEFLRQRGSHVTMINRAARQTIPVPVHASKPLKPGTLRGIIKAAGLTVDEFCGLLD